MSCGCKYWIYSGDCCKGPTVAGEKKDCGESCEPTVDPWGPKLCPEDAPPPNPSGEWLSLEGNCPPCCLHGVGALSSLDLSECEIGDTLVIYICKSDSFAKFELTEGVPCPKKPEVTVSKSQDPCVTDLTALAVGCGQVSYEWYKGQSGDTTNLITTNRVAVALERDTAYWVRVYDDCGFSDSETTTTNPPTIVIEEIIVTETGQATIVVSQSYGPVTYQWFRLVAGGTPVLVGTTATINLTQDGTYFVVVRDSCVTIQSEYIQVSIDRVHEMTPTFGLEDLESVSEMTPVFGVAENPDVSEMAVIYGGQPAPQVFEQVVTFGMVESTPELLPMTLATRLIGSVRFAQETEGVGTIRLIGSCEFTVNDDVKASGVLRLHGSVETFSGKIASGVGRMRLIATPILFTEPLTAVGEDKKIYTLEAGIWIQQPINASVPSVPLRSVAVASDLGKKVAVGDAGVIVGQVTGGSFQPEVVALPVLQSFARVIWDKGISRFLAGGTEGTIIIGDSLGNWSSAIDKTLSFGVPTPFQRIKGFAYGAGTFVAVGDAGIIMTNADPISNDVWVQREFGVFAGNIQSLIWDGTQFVGIGTGGLIITSTDGINWSDVSGPVTASLEDVAYDSDNNIHVAVGPFAVAISTDGGLSWANSPEVFVNITNDFHQGITFDGKNFVISGWNGVIKTSADGTDFNSNISVIAGANKLFDVKAG